MRRGLLSGIGYSEDIDVRAEWEWLLPRMYICMSLSAISDFWGLSIDSIKLDLCRLGVKIRPRGGPNARGKTWKWSSGTH